MCGTRGILLGSSKKLGAVGGDRYRSQAPIPRHGLSSHQSEPFEVIDDANHRCLVVSRTIDEISLRERALFGEDDEDDEMSALNPELTESLIHSCGELFVRLSEKKP